MLMRSLRGPAIAAAVVLSLATFAHRAHAGVTVFESGPVRPLALSPDGTRLFAVNTPDARLEIFAVGAGGLTHTGSVPVGLEPVAVAARTNGEVWVVNHLSDSVSIVDVSTATPRVTRTLLVGDEPRDIVFAGTGGSRAFITCAHRGQNRPGDPQLTTAGVGRADVWSFDANNLGATLGGTPLGVLALFGDTPRALAVSPDGNTVYAAVFHSGNQTTTIGEGVVCDGGAGAAPCGGTDAGAPGGTANYPGGLPAPNVNVQGLAQREVGLIVKFNQANGKWEDRLGRDWSEGVRFSLPDQDVFSINANATPPAQTGVWAHVGTILFNMAVNPANGKVYVTNTDARNEVRFEGPGVLSAGETVRGKLHQARVTVLDGANVLPRHLNKHINYAVVPSPAGTKEKSLAIPTAIAVNGTGSTMYVAAFGSSKIGVLSTSAVENDTFVPSASDHITVSGGGPGGLALDEARNRLYVLTRFDDAVKVVDLATRTEIQAVPMHTPEPASVRLGRPVLYDANLSSSNGESSCASCHVFGDFDSLGWDLGNPDDTLLNNPNPIEFNVGQDPDFHPMKGPMTTQSLRGMANAGPMHWRGDRTGGNDPGGSALDESQAFKKFIVAFEGLLGNAGPISDADMQKFTDFILQVTYPPNPIRALDNSLSATASLAQNTYFNVTSDTVRTCNGCHTLNPALGFFGTDGDTTFENETQMMKIAHLRNAYQKVGMFGNPVEPFVRAGDNGNKGNQIRGFGFLHDGSVDTVFRFLRATVFTITNTQAQQLERFVLEFDSNVRPIVGQQITLTSTNAATVGPRIDLMIARAVAGDCQVVVKGNVAGVARGAVRLANGTFQTDRVAESFSDAALRTVAATPGQELTYTCAPPDDGVRLGIDRDEDGFYDLDEVDAGTDPSDPSDYPGAPTFTTIAGTKLSLRDDSTPPANPDRRRLSFKSVTKLDPTDHRIVLPTVGGAADPSLHGAALRVYNASGLTTDVTLLNLPNTLWTPLGSGGWKYTSNSPKVTIVLKADSLTVKASGAAFGYSLNEPQQGRVGVRLELADGNGWCADVPAKASGNPPSTANNDRPDKFTGAPKTPYAAECPADPNGSPSGAFLQ